MQRLGFGLPMVKCARDANGPGGGMGKFEAHGHQLGGRTGGIVVIMIMFHSGNAVLSGERCGTAKLAPNFWSLMAHLICFYDISPSFFHLSQLSAGQSKMMIKNKEASWGLSAFMVSIVEFISASTRTRIPYLTLSVLNAIRAFSGFPVFLPVFVTVQNNHDMQTARLGFWSQVVCLGNNLAAFSAEKIASNLNRK
jgi:hypothetical protein